MMVMYSGVQLEAFCYDLVPDGVKEDGSPNWDGSSWFGVKPELKEQNPLMNLPWVRVDDQPVVAQSNACFAQVGRATGLWGHSEVENSECEQLLCECMDLRNNMTGFSYGRKYDRQPEKLVSDSRRILDKLELWMAKSSDKTFFVGGHATAPDFHIWEMLDQFELLAKHYKIPSLSESHPNLGAFYRNFAELPQNQRYLSSDLHKLPCNNKMAIFGSCPDGSAMKPGQPYDWAKVGGTY
jgi:glutathione S-transferase